MPPPLSPRRAPPSRRNVAVLSHAEYVPTLTAAAALCVKAALSKAAWWPWPLTFWPRKWCPSHVWRGLHLCLGLSVLDLGPMYATDRRQTASSFYAPPIRGGGIMTHIWNLCVRGTIDGIGRRKTVLVDLAGHTSV